MYIPINIDTDSYKVSHRPQYPAGTEAVSSYLESRNSMWRSTSSLAPVGYDGGVFFGLQYFLKEYMSKPITKYDVDEDQELSIDHGLPFNREPWDILVREHGGRFPVAIEALPEGTVVPAGVPLVQMRNTDPRMYHLNSHLETRMLSAVWYGSTVATLSREIKRICRQYLLQTDGTEKALDAMVIGFFLNDFGSRGVSSQESAQLGGAAHLVNFIGTDNKVSLYMLKKYYNERMAGYSIPAAEHSTITSWGKEREVDAYRNMLTTFGDTNKLIAVVSDSYDIYNAVSNIWGGVLKDEVIAYGAKGGRLVVRPDSGVPEKVVPQILDLLGAKFGYTTNAKGYKVLPPYIGVIQGDGINYESIKRILAALVNAKWAVSNIVFGMGGALLQQVNRDTMGFAMKASAIEIDGIWHDVFKDPVTDTGKKSKRGRQAVFYRDHVGYIAANIGETPESDLPNNLLVPTWRNGRLLQDHTLAAIRERAALR